MTRRLPTWAAAFGALLGCVVVVVARSGDNAGISYAGTTWAVALAMLAATLALFVAAALVESSRLAVVALAAGVCWLAPIPAAWLAAPSALRALATIGATFIFPLLAHLALAAPAGGLRGRLTRGLVAAAYAWGTLVALTLALVREPFYDARCWTDCDGNAFLLRSSPSLSDALVEARPWAELALGVAVAAVAIGRLAKPERLMRLSGLAAVAVGAVAVLHARWVVELPFEDPLDPALRRIFLGASGAAVLVAIAVVAPRLQVVLRRRTVRRVVAALDEAPAPFELERRVGEAVRDPTLRIVFRLPEVGLSVDAAGVPCTPPEPGAGRAVTPLTRRGELVAWVEHDAGVECAVAPVLTPAVRLSIDNARLRAGLLAQVRDLRDARRRIVADGDAERRRLERDLHDGVQQQLLALRAELRSGAGAALATGDPAAGEFEQAVVETAAALEEVRVVAHGIYPAILTDAGLAPAIASLADVAALPVKVVRAPERRYPASIEAAAYRVVAETIENAASYAGATVVAVEFTETSDALVVRVHDDGHGGAQLKQAGGLVELVDRVGAIDGTVSIDSGSDGTTIDAVIPCA